MRNRIRRLFLNIAPFLALAIFKIWASLGQSNEFMMPVALAMLAVCISILVFAFRWDRPKYFDWAVTAYFSIVSIFFVIDSSLAGALLSRYPVSGIYAVLFAAAFLPPLIGLDPFTYQYAKQKTPKEFWDHPFFIRINRIITRVWSAIFFISLLMSLYPSLLTRVIFPLAIILGFGFPFNRFFPRYYLKKKGVPSEIISEKRN